MLLGEANVANSTPATHGSHIARSSSDSGLQANMQLTYM